MKTIKSPFVVKLLFIVSIAISSVSCSNDLISDSGDDDNRNRPNSSENYLTFSSQADFDALVDLLKNEEQNKEKSSEMLRTYAASNPNFVSLRNKLHQIDKKGIITYGDDDADDVEGVTPEEFFFELKVDTLITEDFLQDILNEDLKVGIAEKIYKVTEYGTFVADKSVENTLDQIIGTFDKNKVTNVGEGLYNVAKNIDIQDSYGYIAGVPQIEAEETNEIITPEINTYAYTFSDNPNVNSQTYNINTFGWKSKTFFGQLWGSIFGKQPIRGNNFDNKHRVACELYQVNYFFYKSAGFKVWLQHRKKFLGIKYWKKTTSGVQDLVIGFEEFSGTFKVPTPWSDVRQADKEFESAINNVGYKYIYGQIQKIDFIHDWTDCSVIVGVQKTIEKNVAKTLMSQISNKALEPLRGQNINVQTPKTIYSGFDSGTKKVYLQGFRNYQSNSKSIRFSRAGGFTIIPSKSWVPKPLKVESFSLESASVFGAIKYNNQWRGVRFKVD